MFKTTSATEEKNAQEVVIYNHRDRDIESKAPVNPTSANTNTNTDEAAASDEAEAKAVALFSSKQTQWRCFSKKNMVVCGVACAFVGVAGIVGAASASARSTKQMQESYAEAIIGKGQGGERKGGKNKGPDFSWLEGKYSCLKESGITPVAGIFAVVVEDNVIYADDLYDGDGGEKCPTRARLLITPARRFYDPLSLSAGVAEIQDLLGPEIQAKADVANIVAAASAASVSGKDFSASGADTFLAIFWLKPIVTGTWLFYVFHGVGSFSGDDEITLYSDLPPNNDAPNNDDFSGFSLQSDFATLKVTKSSKNGGTIAVDFYDSFWPNVPAETARSFLFVNIGAADFPTMSPSIV